MKKTGLAIILSVIILSSMAPGIALAKSTFNVTVQEQGLPSNTQWTGYITNHSFTWQINTNAFSQSFSLPNGTFYYQFNDTANYKPLNPNGYFTVDNGTYTLTAQYVPFNSTEKYAITFNPVKLGSGVNWTLNINGLSYTQNSSVTVDLQSSNYSFSASAPGYAFNTSYVFVTHNESVNVTFYKQQYQGLSGQLNEYFIQNLGVSLTVVYIIVGLIVGLIIGFIAMLKVDHAFVLPVPVIAIFLAGLVLGILPLWAAVVLFLFAGAYLIMPIINRSQGAVFDE